MLYNDTGVDWIAKFTMAHAIESRAEWVLAPDRAGMLAANMRAVSKHGVIRDYCGIAHPRTYNDYRFLDAARNAKDRQQALIRFITSSVVIVEENGFNGVLGLLEEGVIHKIHYLSERSFIPPFQVVDTEQGHLLYEQFTKVGVVPITERRVLNVASLSKEEIEASAESDIQFFDNEAKIIEETDFHGKELLPLRATWSEFMQLKRAVADRGFALETLDPLAILSFPGAENLLRLNRFA